MTSSDTSSSRWIFWPLVIALAVLHQDVWFWNDRTLVFGFMPIGLAYHALFSIVAALSWALVVRVAWPSHIEEWADEFENAAADTHAARGNSA